MATSILLAMELQDIHDPCPLSSQGASRFIRGDTGIGDERPPIATLLLTTDNLLDVMGARPVRLISAVRAGAAVDESSVDHR
jgi:hypothetical protein